MQLGILCLRTLSGKNRRTKKFGQEKGTTQLNSIEMFPTMEVQSLNREGVLDILNRVSRICYAVNACVKISIAMTYVR